MPMIFLVLLDISRCVVSYKFIPSILFYSYYCCRLLIYCKYVNSICPFSMALYSLYCGDVLLRNCSLTDLVSVATVAVMVFHVIVSWQRLWDDNVLMCLWSSCQLVIKKSHWLLRLSRHFHCHTAKASVRDICWWSCVYVAHFLGVVLDFSSGKSIRPFHGITRCYLLPDTSECTPAYRQVLNLSIPTS